MSKCKTCRDEAVFRNMCLSCVEGYVEDLEGENVDCVKRVVGLEGQLKAEQEWYNSLMEHCVKGYYKCAKCGGPVAEGFCCAWCGTDTPETPDHITDTEKGSE